jgi:plasmid stabilization system protein ParE
VKLFISPGAAADLERLRAFLADKDPRAAQRAVDILVRSIQSLALFPDRGLPSQVVGLRDLIVPFWPLGL